VVRPPLNIAPVPAPGQRTTIDRITIPQGPGRAPIVQERIVTESMAGAAPVPVVRGRLPVRQRVREPAGYVVTRGAGGYAPGGAPAYAPVADGYEPGAGGGYVNGYVPGAGNGYANGYASPSFAQPVVNPVPAVRPYRPITSNRLLLVDPATGLVVGETD
jgi:hypothetical protein